MMSKDSIKHLLAFLEEKYPNSVADTESLKKAAPPQVNKDDLYRILFFCWEERFINCTPVEESGRVADFYNIRITSAGIRYLRDI